MVKKYFRLEYNSPKLGGWTTKDVYDVKRLLDFNKNLLMKQGFKVRVKTETSKVPRYKRGDIVKSYMGNSTIVSGQYVPFLGDVEYILDTPGYSRRKTSQKGLKLIKRK